MGANRLRGIHYLLFFLHFPWVVSCFFFFRWLSMSGFCPLTWGQGTSTLPCDDCRRLLGAFAFLFARLDFKNFPPPPSIPCSWQPAQSPPVPLQFFPSGESATVCSMGAVLLGDASQEIEKRSILGLFFALTTCSEVCLSLTVFVVLSPGGAR